MLPGCTFAGSRMLQLASRLTCKNHYWCSYLDYSKKQKKIHCLLPSIPNVEVSDTATAISLTESTTEKSSFHIQSLDYLAHTSEWTHSCALKTQRQKTFRLRSDNTTNWNHLIWFKRSTKNNLGEPHLLLSDDCWPDFQAWDKPDVL